MRSAVQIAARTQAREDPVVARFRERVLAALGTGVERIVLFGSRARGDEHAESDWDFAVFLEHDPSEREERRLSKVADAVQSELGVRIQSIALSRRLWLATDELSCNIRDHGRVAYGPATIPMIERPVLQHARPWRGPSGSPSCRTRRLMIASRVWSMAPITPCVMRRARRCSRSKVPPAPITAGPSKPSSRR